VFLVTKEKYAPPRQYPHWRPYYNAASDFYDLGLKEQAIFDE
jgi:hypothetical protein